VQYSFKNWNVDGLTQSRNQISVTMNGPSGVAIYATQYLLTVNSPGGLGNPQGADYYDAGSTAQFSVTSPVGYLVQQVFVQWHGDYAGTSPQGSITMEKPFTKTAVWSTSYKQLIATIAVAGAAVGGLTVWRIRHKPHLKPNEPHPQHHQATMVLHKVWRDHNSLKRGCLAFTIVTVPKLQDMIIISG